MTDAVLNLPQMSNIGVPGQFVFRVDQTKISNAGLIACLEHIFLGDKTKKRKWIWLIYSCVGRDVISVALILSYYYIKKVI
jgi:hypothetical protein